MYLSSNCSHHYKREVLESWITHNEERSKMNAIGDTCSPSTILILINAIVYTFAVVCMFVICLFRRHLIAFAIILFGYLNTLILPESEEVKIINSVKVEYRGRSTSYVHTTCVMKRRFGIAVNHDVEILESDQNLINDSDAQRFLRLPTSLSVVNSLQDGSDEEFLSTCSSNLSHVDSLV